MKRVHVEIIGQGYPLVLIHGWGWHSSIWNPLIADLQQQFQLFVVDLPGFGKSPLLTNNYEFDIVFEELSHQIPFKAAWLGWSLGGTLAWWLAIHRPERVSHLITVASSPKFIADAHWPGVTINTLKKFSQLLIENYQKTLIDFLELQLHGEAQQENLFSELREQLLNTPKTALPALLGGLKLLKETDLRADLKKTICPSLHIFGQYDALIPTHIIPFIYEQIPQAQCEIIERTGHIPFLTQKKIFLNLLYQFILYSDSLVHV